MLALALAACGPSGDPATGKSLYARNCAICHGADARGGGGANVAGFGKTPPDLTRLSAANAGSFPVDSLVMVISGYARGDHAGRRMQPFSDLDSSKSRRVKTSMGRVKVPAPQAALLNYLESVQR